MAIKRPKSPQENEDTIQLVEHLVEKSLAINPKLRKGKKSTAAVVRDLKKEVNNPQKAQQIQQTTQTQSQTHRASTSSNPRLESISFFLSSKIDSVEVKDKELREKIRALKAQREQLKNQLLKEIGDFCRLIGSVSADEILKLTQTQRTRFESLGITKNELIAAIK